MNLSKLFETQKILDDRIVKEKGLEGQDLLDKKILALQVELGELANEHRSFKFWSEDQEPRTVEPIYKECNACYGSGYIEHKNGISTEDCALCEADGKFHIGNKNPLLEEYVDCLHFILSIGLELGADEHLEGNNCRSYMEETNITDLLRNLFTIDWDVLDDDGFFEYFDGFEYFMTLGKELGFTLEQIEQAYFEKNKINHERQESGY